MDLDDPAESEPGYRHPCVILQNDVFNQSRIKTVVVCLITSNLRLAGAPGNVYLAKGEGNLPKDSVVNVSQIITVDRSFLREKIGSLPRSAIEKIMDGVKLLMEPREPV
jgi:mRNA interferase MazF